MPDMMTDMDDRRAAEINETIVTCWMIRAGIITKPVPDLRRISLADAVRSSEIVGTWGPRPDPARPGTSILTCRVEPTQIPKLYAWAILLKENANGP